MWPFRRRRKQGREPSGSASPCPHCGSTEILISTSGMGDGSHVKAWRGQRYVTWRCMSCGREFYTDVPPGGAASLPADDRMIEDENALREAEEELKRRTDEEGDRRYGA